MLQATMPHLRLALLMFVLLTAGLSAACSGLLGPVDAIQLEEPRDQGESTDRTNCDEIYGTRFRSPAERAWFEANCSIWPLVKVPEGDPVAPPAPPENAQLPPQCAEMRGKPYTSSEQRQWYLANCLVRPSTPSATLADAAATPGAGDRTSCDEIRGTPYRSDNERRWYLANCPAPTPTPQQAAPSSPSAPQQREPVAQQQTSPPPASIQVPDNGGNQAAPRGGPLRLRRR